jgi:hypothetical protein
LDNQAKPFKNIENARDWVHEFVQWYNNHHRNSAIRFVTPIQRHAGEDREILKQREAVYQTAKEMTPKQWSGKIRSSNPVTEVWLNPPKEVRAEEQRLFEAT